MATKFFNTPYLLKSIFFHKRSCQSARAIPLFQSSRALFDARSITTMTLSNGDNGDRGDLDGEHNQWKFRAPYKVHDNDPNFRVRYEGSCHCGKIKYQINREKPLDAKFCHCTTCQKIHGKPILLCPPAAHAQFNIHWWG